MTTEVSAQLALLLAELKLQTESDSTASTPDLTLTLEESG